MSSVEPTARSASRESETTLPTTLLSRGFQMTVAGTLDGSGGGLFLVWEHGTVSCDGGGATSLGSSSGNGTSPIPVRSWSHTRLRDRKSTRLNSSHLGISYAVF